MVGYFFIFFFCAQGFVCDENPFRSKIVCILTFFIVIDSIFQFIGLSSVILQFRSPAARFSISCHWWDFEKALF